MTEHPSPPPRPNPRLVRLAQEWEALRPLNGASDLVQVEALPNPDGGPAAVFRVTFRCRGIVEIERDGRPIYGWVHRVRIVCGENFPLHPPRVFAETPLWHPGVSPERPYEISVSLQDWGYGDGSLLDVCRTVFDMIQYRIDCVTTVPPYPRNATVTQWLRDVGEPRGFVNSRLNRFVDDRPFPPAVHRLSGAEPQDVSRDETDIVPPPRRRAPEERPPLAPPRIRVVGQGETVPSPAPLARVRRVGTEEETHRRAEESAELVPEVPLLSYTLASGATVRVVMSPEVCERMARHAEESKRWQSEVGGFLLGTVRRTVALDTPEGEAGYLVEVTDILPIRSASSSLVHVEFNAEAWSFLGEECDRRYSREGKVRIGWYHTHPNQGIFYSRQDLNSHLEWRQPYQVGLVIDPRNMACGLFHWEQVPPDPDSQDLESYLSEPLLFRLRKVRTTRPPSRDEHGYSLAGSAQGELAGRERVPLDQAWLWAILILAGFSVLMAWLLTLPDPYARGPRRTFDPLWMLLTAGGWGLLTMRLWNAGVFHPIPEEWTHDRAGSSMHIFWWRVLGLTLFLGAVMTWGLAGSSTGQGRVFLIMALLLAAFEVALAGFLRGESAPEEELLCRIGEWTAHQFWRVVAGGAWIADRLAEPVGKAMTALLYVASLGVTVGGLYLGAGELFMEPRDTLTPRHGLSSGYGFFLAVLGLLVLLVLHVWRHGENGPVKGDLQDRKRESHRHQRVGHVRLAPASSVEEQCDVQDPPAEPSRRAGER